MNATPRFVQATVTQRPRLSTAAATFSVAQGDRHFSGEGNLTPDISSGSVPLGGSVVVVVEVGGGGGAADVTLDESSAFICVFIFRLFFSAEPSSIQLVAFPVLQEA